MTAPPVPAPKRAGSMDFLSRSCRSCLYFRLTKVDPKQGDAGLCQRFPPILPASNREDVPEAWAFPMMRAESICGEFRIQ